MDAQRRRFYVIIGLAVTFGGLLIGAVLFRREVLFSPPFVAAFLVLGFTLAVVTLFRARQLPRYRKAFLLKAIGIFLAIGGVIALWLHVPGPVAMGMTLSAFVFFALGSHFVIRAAKEESRLQASDYNEKPPTTPEPSPK